MAERASRVTLIADLDEIEREIFPEPIWLCSPRFSYKFANQRMVPTARIVTSLDEVNLLTLPAYEAN